jgi:Skp family chaperone for outer membrane proteins
VKSFFRAAVLTTAALAFAFGSVQSVQAQGAAPATKVGVVNVGYLFTNYKKAVELKKALDTELAPLKEQAEKIKTAMKAHEEWLKNPANRTNLQQQEISKKAMIDGNRALEDLDIKARTMVGKKQETQLVELYREVQVATQQYAQQNGFHIILGYGDPPNLDPFTFANVNRRMTAMDMGTVVITYTQAGLDVSAEVLTRLNGGPPVPLVGTSNPR